MSPTVTSIHTAADGQQHPQASLVVVAVITAVLIGRSVQSLEKRAKFLRRPGVGVQLCQLAIACLCKNAGFLFRTVLHNHIKNIAD